MSAQDRPGQEIARTTLTVLFICLLITSGIWILRPFLSSIVWALIIVVATWPMLLRLQKMLRGRRGLAAAAMTVILLLAVMVPLTAAISIIVKMSTDFSTGVKSLEAFTIPPVPNWVTSIPLGGHWLAEQWQHYASLEPKELAAIALPYGYKLINWFLGQAGSMAVIMLQFLLTVILAAVMYSGGEKTAAGIAAFARRLGGQSGEEVVILAAKAVRSVALGVVTTAVIQTLIAGAGLFICRVPLASVATAVIFIFCLAQLGPLLVLLPAVIWLYWKGDPVLGTVMLVFLIIASSIDNFLRPMLIKKGVDLPLILIFAGVIGGLVSFGAIGLFVGPVILAVAYTLIKAWISEPRAEESQ
jgi:predicted PurR-regulated permease PerM